MSNTKFTKGPWVMCKRGELLLGDTGEAVTVYNCGLSGTGKTEGSVANSQLIKAAPKMYALLLKFLPMDADGNGPFEYNEGSEHLGEEVEALLAKVRGEINDN
jgi:hypothetical protein